MEKRIVIFASGSGTNTQNIMEHFQHSKIAKVVRVLSNNKDAKVLERAKTLKTKASSFTKGELYAENGTLRYSSRNPDVFEYFLETDPKWIKKAVGSQYQPITIFPSGHVSPGWLRALVHAHYIFLTKDSRGSFIPDLAHGLAVQRIVRETADHLKAFRSRIQ